MNFVLASGSPRRRELLKKIVPDFEVCASEETEDCDCRDPRALAETLSLRKAQSVARSRPDAAVLGADTVVAHCGKILGKPKDREDARRMLYLLSGCEHQVYTGVTIVANGRVETASVCSGVRFYPLTAAAIECYLDTGSPLDKAGSYGIQDGFGIVESYSGDYDNIVGLPLACVRELLARLGI